MRLSVITHAMQSFIYNMLISLVRIRILLCPGLHKLEYTSAFGVRLQFTRTRIQLSLVFETFNFLPELMSRVCMAL